MKKTETGRRLLAAAAACAGALAVSAAPGSVGFRFEADHADCLYKVGETAVVTVTATNGAGEAVRDGFVRIEIDNYGRATQKVVARHAFATENPFVLKGSLDKPGFLRVRIEGQDAAGARIGAWWSVGYEPEKIRPATARPADFDAFWDEAVAKFAKEVPLDMTMVKDEAASGTHWKKWDCYRVTFATVPAGRVIRGTLTIPTTGKGPWPVTVNVPGAGSGSWGFVRRDGRAYLILNVVDYPCFPDETQTPAVLYAEQNARWSGKTGNGAGPYYFHGDFTKGREDYFYYGAILGVNRAVDAVADLPQIDATKDFRYEGMSQGGAFGIYLTALNRHFTRALLAEPALTDVCGMLADGRQSGWPILPEQHEGKPFYANMMKMLPYFDTVHFAPRVKVPVRCYVGFVDILCPPQAVWAGFNCLGSTDKKMLNVPGLDHGSPRALWQASWDRCDGMW